MPVLMLFLRLRVVEGSGADRKPATPRRIRPNSAVHFHYTLFGDPIASEKARGKINFFSAFSNEPNGLGGRLKINGLDAGNGLYGPDGQGGRMGLMDGDCPGCPSCP